MQLSTSTKPILKEVSINYTENKVVQLLDNAIIKGNPNINEISMGPNNKPNMLKVGPKGFQP
jgi:hypothetical protein